MTEEEANLIRRARQGEVSAMRGLLDYWRPHVLRIAEHILGNSDDAHDVCQDALIELSLTLGDIREPAAMPGFVRQVVQHQCFDFRRRKATRRLSSEDWCGFDAAQEDADAVDRLLLWDAIEQLPESEREVLVMDYVQGRRHGEIATDLRVSIPTVRSRLQSAKRRLRADLKELHEPQNMQPDPIVQQLLDAAYPGAVIDSIHPDPETWVPYAFRLTLQNGETLTIRKDVNSDQADLLPHLRAQGVPVPTLITGPVQAAGTSWSLWKEPNGQNLSRWTMDGTYHRFRTATDVAFEALDRLQTFTDANLKKTTIQDRFAELSAYNGPWSNEKDYQKALDKLTPLVRQAENRLVYTHYLHFFPNLLRIKDGALGEIVWPFGALDDPLIGLAMVWIYDCYPFVHTGFVEQYLVRQNIEREEFALRLAVQSLVILTREANETNPKYGTHLMGLAKRGLDWL